MLKAMKRHWFSMLMMFLFVIFLGFFAAVLIAPKELFFFCTEKLRQDLVICENRLACTAKSIVESAYCNFKTVVVGMEPMETIEEEMIDIDEEEDIENE